MRKKEETEKKQKKTKEKQKQRNNIGNIYSYFCNIQRIISFGKNVERKNFRKKDRERKIIVNFCTHFLSLN